MYNPATGDDDFAAQKKRICRNRRNALLQGQEKKSA